MSETIMLKDGLILTCATPAEFPSSLLSPYQALLAEGNAVRIPDAAHLTRAYRWAIIQEPVSAQIVAAGALKQTGLNLHYYRTIFSPHKASLSMVFSAANYPFDLGYIVTAPLYRRRGYSDFIIDALLEQCSNRGVLATTQDHSIQGKLIRRGFERQGSSWQANEGGALNLYLRSDYGSSPI